MFYKLNLSFDFDDVLLARLDKLFSSLVIGPAAIGYWRGTWAISDFYIFPADFRVSLIVSGVLGILVQMAFTMGKEFLDRNVRPDRQDRIVYFLLSRLYTYVYGLACINMWRGTWKALDYFSGTELVQVILPTLISFVVIVCLKGVRNLLSAPFIVVVDDSKNYFQVTTMFRLSSSCELSLHVLDCFFSVFVIGSLVVFIWRGVWCLIDIFLFPENEKYSALTSLAIGYALVIIVFGLQNPMEKLMGKLTGFWRLFTADIYVFVAFLGTINLWRGIWNLLNIYFLPDFPIWSNWITHLGCFAILVIFKCSNTVLVRGVYLDGEDGGKCVVFPAFYFSLYFQKLRRKKVEASQKENNSCNGKKEEIEIGEKENSETNRNGENKSKNVKTNVNICMDRA